MDSKAANIKFALAPQLFVVDLDRKCFRFTVKVLKLVKELIELPPSQFQSYFNVYFSCPEFFFGYFLPNLQEDMLFRLRFRNLLRSRDRTPFVVLRESKYQVDKTSGEMSLQKAHGHVELLTMLSWFSTFGGAYSNLGDEFEKCAEMAGKISVHQLKLAFQLGDPFLISRCKLYYSIALIQRGYIPQAKKIVRSEYQMAKQEEEVDPKLLKMCLGIWSKLVYTRHQLKANKTRIRNYLLRLQSLI